MKATRGGDKFITITESRKIFDNNTGEFYFDKNKIFLYKEDFEKVAKGLTDAINYVETGELPADYYDEPEPRHYDREDEPRTEIDSAIDRWFDNLDK